MRIAVLSEADPVETRVAITPDMVKKYKALGADVIAQAGAGGQASIADAEFEVAGATIAQNARDAVKDADIVLAPELSTSGGPYKNGPGEINVPVSIGGWIVNPGDIVVGDEDGIVTFPPDIAPALIEAVRVQEAKEAEILQMIRDGKYDGRYGRAA